MIRETFYKRLGASLSAIFLAAVSLFSPLAGAEFGHLTDAERAVLQKLNCTGALSPANDASLSAELSTLRPDAILDRLVKDLRKESVSLQQLAKFFPQFLGLHPTAKQIRAYFEIPTAAWSSHQMDTYRHQNHIRDFLEALTRDVKNVDFSFNDLQEIASFRVPDVPDDGAFVEMHYAMSGQILSIDNFSDLSTPAEILSKIRLVMTGMPSGGFLRFIVRVEPLFQRRAPTPSEQSEFAELKKEVLALDSRIKNEIRRATKQFLVMRLEASNAKRISRRSKVGGYPEKKPGETIWVGLQRYKIILTLGDGREGIVYLAKGPDGLRVVKKYTTLATMQTNNRGYARVWAFRTLNVERSNSWQLASVMNYVRGLTLHDLSTYQQPFGIGREFVTEMENRWRATQRLRGQYFAAFANIVIEEATGDFVQIDFN